MELIKTNPQIMQGKPIIKGTRITVEHIISLLAQDNSIEEILQEYQGLQRDDILACLKH